MRTMSDFGECNAQLTAPLRTGKDSPLYGMGAVSHPAIAVIHFEPLLEHKLTRKERAFMVWFFTRWNDPYIELDVEGIMKLTDMKRNEVYMTLYNLCARDIIRMKAMQLKDDETKRAIFLYFEPSHLFIPEAVNLAGCFNGCVHSFSEWVDPMRPVTLEEINATMPNYGWIAPRNMKWLQAQYEQGSNETRTQRRLAYEAQKKAQAEAETQAQK